jgi:hypothetical protein
LWGLSSAVTAANRSLGLPAAVKGHVLSHVSKRCVVPSHTALSGFLYSFYSPLPRFIPVFTRACRDSLTCFVCRSDEWTSCGLPPLRSCGS